MKFSVFFFCILLGFSSCVKQEVGDYILEYSMDFTIQPDGNSVSTKVFSQIITSNWIQFLNRNNLDENQIASIRAKNVFISPILANPISYGFISKAESSFYIESDPGGKLPFGEAFPQPNDSKEDFYLNPGLANLKSFISNPEFVVELALNYRNSPTSFSDHRLTFQLDVFLK